MYIALLPTETTLTHYTIGHVADKGGGMGWDDCGSRGGGGLQSKLVRACARLIRQGLIILSHVTLDAVQVGGCVQCVPHTRSGKSPGREMPTRSIALLG